MHPPPAQGEEISDEIGSTLNIGQILELAGACVCRTELGFGPSSGLSIEDVAFIMELKLDPP